VKIEKLISNPEKVFWPEEGYTKLDIARFYERVFPRLKPYLADRLLAMERCPDGMRGDCFYQKEKPKGMPSGTPTKAIRHEKRTLNYVVGGLLETQIALVNLGCIPVHMWASRAHHEHQPDWLVFDIDPGSGKFSDAAEAGLLVKRALDELNLASFPKTSGGRGMHVFVPLRLGPKYEEVLPFAKAICERVAAAHPKEVTVEQRIEARKNRVYLDAFRNGFGATVAAPYSIRRRAHAPFSMPLAWRDVKPTLAPIDFNLGNYEKWMTAPDPWSKFFDSRQSLKMAIKALSVQEQSA
jgi:bifunctional non-homologous end joining protein LigD